MMNVIYLDLTQEQLDEAIAQWKARQNAPGRKMEVDE